MTKPSEPDSDHGVDQKLDSLISRIQLLGGEGKRPKQLPGGAGSDVNFAGRSTEGKVSENVGGAIENVASSETPAPAVNVQPRAVQRRSIPRQVRPVRSGRQTPSDHLQMVSRQVVMSRGGQESLLIYEGRESTKRCLRR